MATLIGNLTAGGGGDFFGDGDAFGSKWTCSATGSLTTVTLPDPTVSSNFTSLKVGVYANNAGVPGTFLGQSDALTNNLGTTKVLTFSTPVALTVSTDYWLIALPVGGNVTTELATTGGYSGKALGAGVSTFPSPWDASGNSGNGAGGAFPMLGEGTTGGGSTDPARPALVVPPVAVMARSGWW